MKFTYNNSYQATIGMTLYEALHDEGVKLIRLGKKWVIGS
jgi:hypothetical protein